MLRARGRLIGAAVAAVMAAATGVVGGCQAEAGCAGRSTPEETLAGFLRAAAGNDVLRARIYADITYDLDDVTVAGWASALADVATESLDLAAEQHGELFYFDVTDDAGAQVGTFSVRRSDRCHGVLWAEVVAHP